MSPLFSNTCSSVSLVLETTPCSRGGSLEKEEGGVDLRACLQFNAASSKDFFDAYWVAASFQVELQQQVFSVAEVFE